MAGLRSAPPPNQRRVVVRKRVFMWTAGTCGFAMCATRLMPVAKKLGSSSAPGMLFANSGEKRPATVEGEREGRHRERSQAIHLASSGIARRYAAGNDVSVRSRQNMPFT